MGGECERCMNRGRGESVQLPAKLYNFPAEHPLTR